MKVPCKASGKVINVPDRLNGKRFKCPACGDTHVASSGSASGSELRPEEDAEAHRDASAGSSGKLRSWDSAMAVADKHLESNPEIGLLVGGDISAEDVEGFKKTHGGKR